MAKFPQTVKVYTDGCAKGNPGPAGAGFVLEDLSGEVLDRGAIALGRATNNEAEYRALILAMGRCLEHGVRIGLFYTDSELMARQLNGVYRIKSERLARLASEVKGLSARFENFSIAHVRRERNTEADRLANLALTDEGGEGETGV